MRILLLTDVVMNPSDGGINQTLYNLLSFSEPENILCVTFGKEIGMIKPAAPFTKRHITYDFEIIPPTRNRLSKYINPFIDWFNFTYNDQFRRFKKIKQQIALFKPDVIISCPNGPMSVLMHKILFNKSKFSIPIVPYFMDDWMLQTNKKWLGGSVYDIVGEMLIKNKQWLMISDELCDILKERYSTIPEKVLFARNPVDINNAPPDAEYFKGDPFTIAYAGALWPMHFDSFYAFAKAMQSINVKLIWYGQESQWNWRKNELIPLGVIYKGHIAYDDIHATLNKADALLITSSFEKEFYNHSKSSLQTKITDYSKSKRLIISCGPDYSANHNFIKKNDLGICIETSDISAIAEQILPIVNNIYQYKKYIDNAFESLKGFSKEVVHRNLKLFLSKVIEETVPANKIQSKPNVFIFCTGVGHINRGYESFTNECFSAIKDNDYFELYLLKGGGSSTGNEIKISCIKRESSAALFISGIVKKEAYWIEQFTFFIGMLPSIIKYKPTVIYYSDFRLGTFLWHLRRFFKLKYKLLYSNGAPNGPPFKTEDHVQQLLPVHMDKAIKHGAPAAMQTLLPYGFDINIKERIIAVDNKEGVRAKLGFTSGQKVILSVGAINKHHKRMDYVIDEVSKLPGNYFLVILGQFETETPGLIELAANKLPGRHLITSIPFEKVKDYYIASDYFVLGSLTEGFGRVLVEALSYGLPCIVHDYINSRQVLNEYGNYINMQEPGALSSFISSDGVLSKNKDLINAAYRLYSWDELKDQYYSMINKLVNFEE